MKDIYDKIEFWTKILRENKAMFIWFFGAIIGIAGNITQGVFHVQKEDVITAKESEVILIQKQLIATQSQIANIVNHITKFSPDNTDSKKCEKQ